MSNDWQNALNEIEANELERKRTDLGEVAVLPKKKKKKKKKFNLKFKLSRILVVLYLITFNIMAVFGGICLINQSIRDKAFEVIKLSIGLSF